MGYRRFETSLRSVFWINVDWVSVSDDLSEVYDILGGYLPAANQPSYHKNLKLYASK